MGGFGEEECEIVKSAVEVVKKANSYGAIKECKAKIRTVILALQERERELRTRNVLNSIGTGGRILSLEEIELGKSKKGGFTRTQLKEWGVSWPPPKGWRSRLMGKHLEEDKENGKK